MHEREEVFFSIINVSLWLLTIKSNVSSTETRTRPVLILWTIFLPKWILSQLFYHGFKPQTKFVWIWMEFAGLSCLHVTNDIVVRGLSSQTRWSSLCLGCTGQSIEGFKPCWFTNWRSSNSSIVLEVRV